MLMVSKYHPLMMKHAKGSIKARPSQPRGETRLAVQSRRRRREFPPLPSSPRGEVALWLAAREAWPGIKWRCFTLNAIIEPLFAVPLDAACQIS
ncbi:MAG: hypothetical protein RugAbin2_02259 [Rugosibacter sp.]|nr:hypothetical protein [Rugosibacter sp.]